MPEEFRAVLRHSHISPRKMRYVTDIVRNKQVNAALDILRATPNRGSYMLIKLIKSAIANANNRSPHIDVDTLMISRLVVDCGPIVHRWRPTTMGRAVPIRKRTSHITVVLKPAEEETPEVKKTAKKDSAKAKSTPVEKPKTNTPKQTT
ncbi:MAG: 50S ribosomal protein L22 [Planctomycetes bacterium]|nr:50S ribosomal protein L22 [Planctomycetota bacterium]